MKILEPTMSKLSTVCKYTKKNSNKFPFNRLFLLFNVSCPFWGMNFIILPTEFWLCLDVVWLVWFHFSFLFVCFLVWFGCFCHCGGGGQILFVQSGFGFGFSSIEDIGHPLFWLMRVLLKAYKPTCFCSLLDFRLNRLGQTKERVPHENQWKIKPMDSSG